MSEDNTQPEAQDNVEEAVIDEDIDLAKQLEEVQSQAEEYLEGWRRAKAEVVNMKRRSALLREQTEFEVLEKLTRGLLTVLDDFDLAVQNMPDELKEVEWVNGVFAIRRKLLTEIENLGVTEINPLGESFDPNFHEGIGQVESDDYESGQVAEVLRKGYVLGERVIRPALVRVAA